MNTYELNVPDVIADNFDGETVIVNLNSGKYFSIRGKSQPIFAHLSEGVPLDKITAAFLLPATVSAETAQKDLKDFAKKLVLLKILKETTISSKKEELAALAYEKLAIEVFTDMDEIIMVDPINELEV